MKNNTTKTTTKVCGVSYAKFKQLWKQYCPTQKFPKGIVDNGTPIANEELEKYAQGLPSAFDAMDAAK